jgi:hypothetical protein
MQSDDICQQQFQHSHANTKRGNWNYCDYAISLLGTQDSKVVLNGRLESVEGWKTAISPTAMEMARAIRSE